MKHSTAAIIVLLIAPLALAQGNMNMEMDKNKKSMNRAPMTSAPGVHKGTGVVKSFDAKSSTVTLAHGPIASMYLPSMTMTFKTEDVSLSRV